MHPARSNVFPALAFAALSCSDPTAPLRPSLPSSPVSAAHGPIRIAALAPGDSVVIDVEMKGCFHSSKHVISVVPASSGATLSISTSDQRTPSTSASRAQVAPDDLAQLDRLLEYYRTARPEGFCTSSETGAVILFREGQAVAYERFEDSSCPDFGTDTTLTLSQLVYRSVPRQTEHD